MRVMVVLSGGMDSSTLLYYLVSEGHNCQAISIRYGQRHRREVKAARKIAESLDVEHHVVDLDHALFGRKNALTGGVPVPHGHYANESMRVTVVPNRNMVFLALAAARAIAEDCAAIAYGAHAGDHTIYPDCRLDFVDAMRQSFALCHYDGLQLLAPFVGFDKTQIALLGADLGVPFNLTWTCYEGGELHCGRCGACVERREALATIPGGDLTTYAV